MKNFITRNKLINIFCILFWLIIWHILSVIIGEDIILTSPISVFKRVFSLMLEKDFFITIFNSLFKVSCGFLIGSILGVLLAIFCKKSYILYKLFIVPITFMKVTPIACFIVLVLIWLNANMLSILISIFMSLPIFFFNIYNGIDIIRKDTLQMCNIFKISKVNKIIYVYFPNLFKIILTTSTLSFSMSWKAGVAGEIIGIANYSIGGKLQEAKTLLETNDLLAWTIIIITISLLIEKLITFILKSISFYFKVDNYDRT